MLLYLSITAICSCIGLLCLRKRFSFGVIPVIIVSSIISCIICSIYNTIQWYSQGHDTIKYETVRYQSTNNRFEMKENGLLGSEYNLDEINNVAVIDTIKKPYIIVDIEKRRKDVGLLFNVGSNKETKRTLYLNKEQYGIYKNFVDSIGKGKNTL